MENPATCTSVDAGRTYPTTIAAAGAFGSRSRLTRTLRWMGAALIILLLQGCTNSKLIISPLYNRLDDQIRGEFNKLGDFNDQQREAFEASLGTFHVWHRQSELPQYAELFTAIASSVANADTTAADITLWMDTAERHSKAARECHPINFLTGMIKTLPVKQINFIERRFKRQQDKNRTRYDSRTPEERIERRLSNIVKWAGRIGLDFTATQRAMFLSTFKQQVSLRKEYYRLSGEWNRQHFKLARNKLNPNYERDMQAHLGKLWKLLESEYPEKWQANRDLWKDTALRFVQSMTDEQRDIASRWMNKMGATLVSISEDEPSFKVVDNPSIGCLVDAEKT